MKVTFTNIDNDDTIFEVENATLVPLKGNKVFINDDLYMVEQIFYWYYKNQDSNYVEVEIKAL